MKVSHLAPHSSSHYGVDFIKSTDKFDIQPMSYRHMPEGLYVQGLSCVWTRYWQILFHTI
jgi:hypothetical protein